MLEQKIRDHAGEIFGNEPADGHRERFAGKLAARKKGKRIAWKKFAGYVAAAAILTGLLIASPWRTPPDDGQEESPQEVRNYYALQLEHEADGIRQLLQKMDAVEREKIRKDIASIQEEPVQEEDIALIVRVYYLKIEALQHIHQVLINHI
jgi:hypothetical protein